MYGQKHNGSENKLSSVIECTSEPDIDPAGDKIEFIDIKAALEGKES